MPDDQRDERHAGRGEHVPLVATDLYDTHIAQLLDEAVYHIEHLRLGVRDMPSATA